MVFQVRQSLPGKLLSGLWLTLSLMLTLKFFLLGIQNLSIKSYFIVMPMLLLIYFLGHLLHLNFSGVAPVRFDGEGLIIAEAFSGVPRTFPVSEILSLSVEKGITGSRLLVRDERGMTYSISGLDPDDLSRLRSLPALNVL